jgi:hypothetical protein
MGPRGIQTGAAVFSISIRNVPIKLEYVSATNEAACILECVVFKPRNHRYLGCESFPPF